MVKIGAIGDNGIDDYVDLGIKHVGGNALNVAMYVKRQGGYVIYAGVTGNDENGELIRNTVKEKGLDKLMIKTGDGPSAVNVIELVNNNRVFKDYIEGVLTQFSLTEDEIEELGKCDIVVSSVWSYADDYFKPISEKGAKTAMDFSTELESPVIDKIGPYLDYAFFSFEEGDNYDLEDYMKKVKDKIKGMVIVTRGEDGSVAYDGKEFTYHGIEPCEVVDTLGAGDSFIAGFLFGMASGMTIKESMINGAKNSSITIAYEGAW